MQLKWKKVTIISILVIVIIGFFIPVPYYISKPGSAEELEPLVSIESYPKKSNGSFSLVTIAMAKANIYTSFMAKLLPYYELEKKSDILYDNESNEEYNVRQMYLMNQSKNNAILVAYKAANQQVNLKYNGIYVLSVLKGAPAEKSLHSGDLISAIDGHIFKSSQEFIDYIRKKKINDKVKITFTHKEMQKKVSVPLTKIDKKGTAGIGITLVDDQKITTNPKIQINSEEIGGPSAGLMFSLEIYNRLQKIDLTKGYKIAGTGTIDSSGEVGRIGGIDQKVVAADHSKAEIFFAPDDKITDEMKKENPNSLTNYKLAKKTAQSIHSKMKIVPVKTFQDAVHYLEKLKTKQR